VTPDALRRLAFGFREARALFAGVELGVFEALGERACAASGARRGARPRRAGLAILLEALVALGVLRATASAYEIPLELRPVLLRATPSTRGTSSCMTCGTGRAGDGSTPRCGGRGLDAREGDPHLGNPAVLRRFRRTTSRPWSRARAA
jgi:hypothetical protein